MPQNMSMFGVKELLSLYNTIRKNKELMRILLNDINLLHILPNIWTVFYNIAIDLKIIVCNMEETLTYKF